MDETKLKVPCEVYSRIVGYLRPIQQWHAGKQQEFGDRLTFQPLEIEKKKQLKDGQWK